MRGKISFWVKLIFILLIFALVFQLTAPRYFERKITDYIYSSVEEAEVLSVSLHSFPALKFFLGRVDRASVRFLRLQVDDLMLAEGRLGFADLQLGRTPSGYAFTKGRNTDLKLVITRKALNAYLEKYYQTSAVKVDLNPGKVVLSLTLNWFEQEIKFSLLGSLVVESPARVVFVGKRLNVNGKGIPGVIWNQLEDRARFALDLGSLPFPVEIHQVVVREDQITLLGKNGR